jgi:hypothetical protein
MRGMALVMSGNRTVMSLSAVSTMLCNMQMVSFRVVKFRFLKNCFNATKTISE